MWRAARPSRSPARPRRPDPSPRYASSRCASASMSARSARASRRKGSIRSRPSSRNARHRAAVNPSTSTCPQPTSVQSLVSADTMRDRSSCPSTTLSYSGRNRTGAGVSGSGSGARGASTSSRPCSSRNVRRLGRSLSMISAAPGRPDHARRSAGAAGPNTFRYRITSSSGASPVAIGAPTQDSSVVNAERPLRRHNPRGVTCTVGNR